MCLVSEVWPISYSAGKEYFLFTLNSICECHFDRLVDFNQRLRVRCKAEFIVNIHQQIKFFSAICEKIK